MNGFALVAALTVAQAVANVDAFYKTVGTFSAGFTQEYLAFAYNTTKTDSGTLAFARPGKMAFAYASGTRVVSNGQALFVRSASGQLTSQPAAQSQYPAVFSFLTGTGSIASGFSFTMQPSTAGLYILVGTPTTPTPAFTTALFYVDDQTSQIRRVLLIDAQRNRNRFDFTNVTVNMPLAPTTFRP